MNGHNLCKIEGAGVSLDDLLGGDADDDDRRRLRAGARQAVNDKDGRYFGFQPYSAESPEGEFGYYVGIGRLPEASECTLHISARQFRSVERAVFQIDYVRMYADCAADPDVSRHLSRCLTVYPDEMPIEVDDDDVWSPLIALAYLNALHILVQRHLRRDFIAREETLYGRARGQIRVGRYITQYRSRGHPEAVPCRFGALEHDTPENRILRTALVGAKRLLDRQTGRNLANWHTWARQADVALAGAAIARIEPRDFQAARKTGAYRHYATPLALGKAVLTRVGFDPNQRFEPDAIGRKVRMVPFRLKTEELFERYVEARLRAMEPVADDDGVWVGYDDKNLEDKICGSGFLVRPDFLVRWGDLRLILDAKYKDFSKQKPGGSEDENSFRWDTYQVLAYSQHRGVKQQLSGRPGDGAAPSAMILCYPVNRSGVLSPLSQTQVEHLVLRTA